MLRLHFTNAVVVDDGYGLSVDGRPLSEIISTVLGTKVGNTYGYASGLPSFKSNCCDILVVIDPKPSTVFIEDDDYEYNNIEEMEGAKREQYRKKNETADTEE